MRLEHSSYNVAVSNNQNCLHFVSRHFASSHSRKFNDRNRYILRATMAYSRPDGRDRYSLLGTGNH